MVQIPWTASTLEMTDSELIIYRFIKGESTFHCYLCHGLYHSQGWHGHTGVVGRLPDICELQDIASDGHVVLRREVFRPQHPFDIGHGGAHRHTRDIDAATRHDLIVCRRDGEPRWHPAYWWKKTKYGVRRLQNRRQSEFLLQIFFKRWQFDMWHEIWQVLIVWWGGKNSFDTFHSELKENGLTPTWAPCTNICVYISPSVQINRTTQGAGQSAALCSCRQRNNSVGCALPADVRSCAASHSHITQTQDITPESLQTYQKRHDIHPWLPGSVQSRALGLSNVMHSGFRLQTHISLVWPFDPEATTLNT